jgi:hypothetical protein
MVRSFVREALLAVIALAIWSCSADTPPQDVPQADSTAVVTASDTAQATTLTLQEAALDTFAVRYKVGDVLRYRVTQASEAVQDSSIAQQRSSHVYTKTVRSVNPDGTFTVAMRFDSINVAFTARNRASGATLANKSYASSDSTQRSSAEFTQYNALLGESVDLVIDHRGGIVRVGSVSKIVDQLLKSVGQNPPPGAKEQLTAQVQGAIYGAFHGQEIIPFPAKPLDSTGTWTNAMTTPIAELFTVATTATYKVTSVKKIRDHRIATIDAGVTGRMNVRPLPREAGISVSIDKSSINGSSAALLDVDGGYTISKKNTISMNVTATVRGGQRGERQTVSMSQTMRYEIELLP